MKEPSQVVNHRNRHRHLHPGEHSSEIHRPKISVSTATTARAIMSATRNEHDKQRQERNKVGSKQHQVIQLHAIKYVKGAQGVESKSQSHGQFLSDKCQASHAIMQSRCRRH